MAILKISNEYLRDPEIWDMIDNYADIKAIVKQDSEHSVIRIVNDELPVIDMEVDLVAYSFHEVRPFIIGFREKQLYQP